MSPTPQRTCAGCGRTAPQSELVRFGAIGVKLVAGRTVPGRGAYTCRVSECFERARARGSFSRVLRMKVTIDPALARIYTDDPNG